MNKISTLIISGGRIDKDFALSFLENKKFEKIIAVDGGLSFLQEIGQMPTDIVGDFDTVEEDVLAAYEHQEGVSIRRFQPEKDDTDSEIAVKLALEYGSTQIDILGASGTRLDHTIGNIRLLGLIHQACGKMCNESVCDEQLCGEPVRAYIYDKNNRIRLVEKECVIRKAETYGKYVSILPFTQRVEGITLRGFKYPLENHTMDILEAPTLGISNEIVGEEGCITAKSGILLVIESSD